MNGITQDTVDLDKCQVVEAINRSLALKKQQSFNNTEFVASSTKVLATHEALLVT